MRASDMGMISPLIQIQSVIHHLGLPMSSRRSLPRHEPVGSSSRGFTRIENSNLELFQYNRLNYMVSTDTTPPRSPAAPEWDEKLLKNPHAVSDKRTRVQKMFAAIAPSYDINNRLHSLWM